MDAQTDLKAICVDPRAYYFFPNRTFYSIKPRSRRLASIKKELDFSSTAKSSTMIMKRKNWGSSKNTWRNISILSTENFGTIKSYFNSSQEMAIKMRIHLKL
jgi:hypothetical protein